MIEVIAFDADDTLWDNETLFKEAENKLAELLAAYHPADFVIQTHLETEGRNIKTYGYGVKGFTLSMIETAIDLTEGKIPPEDIRKIIGFGREMLDADVVLLEGVRKTIAKLSASYPLMIITKGDLLDQQRKVARSGLGDFFKHIEVVSDKTNATYEAILAKYDITPNCFLMVGNSLKSDVLPVIEIGGQAVYVPNSTTWAHEAVSPEDADQKEYNEIENLGQLVKTIGL